MLALKASSFMGLLPCIQWRRNKADLDDGRTRRELCDRRGDVRGRDGRAAIARS
jgi:hypothetical protein